MSLIYISQQITIYFGWFIVLAGFVGNSLNILIFSSARNYRTTPCTFYFLILSINNIITIAVNMISRIFIAGYLIDFTRTSSFWCKLRAYLICVVCLIAFTLSCLASMDQFFATSKSTTLRRVSNIKWAHRITITVIIICCLHGIFNLFFYDAIPITQICGIINAQYAVYAAFYILGLTCFIPIIIMAIFGYLTYRNIHLVRALAEQQADYQLIRMTLIQIILIVTSIGPFGVNYVYSLLTSTTLKGIDRLLIEAFILSMSSLLTNVNYIGSFYMFLMTSSRFRRHVKDRILFWQTRNRIVPFQRTGFQVILSNTRTKN